MYMIIIYVHNNLRKIKNHGFPNQVPAVGALMIRAGLYSGTRTKSTSCSGTYAIRFAAVCIAARGAMPAEPEVQNDKGPKPSSLNPQTQARSPCS